MSTVNASVPIDPARCPLCGGPNACAMTCSEPATRCWCVNETFSAQLLARVPVHLQRVACICARCAQADREVTSTPADKA